MSLVNTPVMAPTILAAAHLNKAVIHGQVVSDTVPPARAPAPEVGKLLLHCPVDGCQVEFLGGGGQDNFGDQSDVGERRL